MHFGPNECTHCGYVRAPYNSEHIVHPDGILYRLENYECAFCSDKCLEKAVQPYINDRFNFHKNPEADPDIRRIVENLQNVLKLIDSNTLKSNEERAELEEHRAYHADALKEACQAWDEAQTDAIAEALTEYIVRWARECNVYHSRVLDKALVEKKREIEREQREEEAQRKRELGDLQRKRKELERETAALQREYKQQLRDEERKIEKERQDFDKAYERAEADHADFMKQEALEKALQYKPIPEHIRIHTAVIAKTGWGKTQLLQSLILDELRKPDPASMVILDSTGQMANTIQRLAVFNGRLRDRLVIVDPAYAPSLNMFDLSNPRFDAYSPEQKEDVQTELVGLFKYVFASKEYDLTGPMGLAFPYAVRLILSRPGSGLTDLRHLLEETPKHLEDSVFASHILKLDPETIDFFRNHFFADSIKPTRAAIARRLYLMTAIPAFRRMFITSKNTLDLYHETQDKGSIIVINTNENLLKEEGYVLFGRYIIARLIASIYERATIKRETRRTTHLIIDETGPYLDETFDTLLTRVRQFGLKVTIAFQHYMQLSDKLKNAVAGQTSVKYVGGVSADDARTLAKNMRCTHDFLLNLTADQSQKPTWAQFAVYADNFTTTHPMLMRLHFGEMESEPAMSDDEHAAVIERITTKFSSPKTHEAPETEASLQLTSTPAPDLNPKEPSPRAAATTTQEQSLSPNVDVNPTDPHTGDHTEPATKWGDDK